MKESPKSESITYSSDELLKKVRAIDDEIQALQFRAMELNDTYPGNLAVEKVIDTEINPLIREKNERAKVLFGMYNDALDAEARGEGQGQDGQISHKAENFGKN